MNVYEGRTAMAVEQQLSLEIGGEIGAGIVSTFRISGSVDGVAAQLDRDELVHVVVTDADGEVVFSKFGKVAGVGIESQEKSGVKWTERRHKIKFAEAA